jgi:hypothetical protein
MELIKKKESKSRKEIGTKRENGENENSRSHIYVEEKWKLDNKDNRRNKREGKRGVREKEELKRRRK